jgi:hypothetical protein
MGAVAKYDVNHDLNTALPHRERARDREIV